MKNIVQRTTLIVRDIQRSAHWYEHVLGMTRWYDKEFVLSGVGLAAGKAGDRTHLMILKAEDPVIGMIGLLQWLEPELPAPPEIPTGVTYGLPTFIVSSDDVNEVHRRAVEPETHIHAEPHEWSTEGADGNMKTFLGLSVFDPDGYFYEFNQLLHSEPADGS